LSSKQEGTENRSNISEVTKTECIFIDKRNKEETGADEVQQKALASQIDMMQ